MRVLENLDIATMAEGGAPYGLVPDGAIVLDGTQVAWVGPQAELPSDWQGCERVDLGGRLVTPALIDCHTHLVFAGSRVREFEMRLNGASYEEIARAGGGILSTVTGTREASEAELLRDALNRADALIAEGVSTVEVKSGYGLDVETELKMLHVARQIPQHRDLSVSCTFLGAHAVPKGMDAEAYLDDVCLPALRQAHTEGLVDAVDGFCEGIAFDAEQMRKVFAVARELGLPVKLHSDQLSNIGGARVVEEFAALSADHVEYIDEAGVECLKRAGAVAALLPGAFYFLKEQQRPPVDMFRKHGVPMALATDWNPGSSPLGSLLLTMNMGCTLFGMTPAEALAGTTRIAAQALGFTDRGVVASGKRADLAVWDAEHPAELSFHIGFNRLHTRIHGGRID